MCAARFRVLRKRPDGRLEPVPHDPGVEVRYTRGFYAHEREQQGGATPPAARPPPPRSASALPWLRPWASWAARDEGVHAALARVHSRPGMLADEALPSPSAAPSDAELDALRRFGGSPGSRRCPPQSAPRRLFHRRAESLESPVASAPPWQRGPPT